jgi:thymidylate kinase
VYLATPSRKRPADAAAPRVAAEPAPWGTDVPPDAATLLRERSALLSHAWVSLVAIANAVAHQRAVLRHVARGRVVICDRYTLDSLVHVSTRFGEARSWRFERALVRALSPRPLKAYFLDVPAEIAWSRKQEDDPAWLERLAERYRAEHASVGAERVDGAQPLEDVAAALAESAWRALG